MSWFDRDSLSGVGGAKSSPAPRRQRAGKRSTEMKIAPINRRLDRRTGQAAITAKSRVATVTPNKLPIAAAARVARPSVVAPRATIPVRRAPAVMPSKAPAVVTRPKTAPRPSAPSRAMSKLASTLGALFGDGDDPRALGLVDDFGVPDGWQGQNYAWITADLWADFPDDCVPRTNNVRWVHRIAFPVVDDTALVDLSGGLGVGGLPVPCRECPNNYTAINQNFLMGRYQMVDANFNKVPRPQSPLDGRDLDWSMAPPRADSLSLAPVYVQPAESPIVVYMPISGYVEGVNPYLPSVAKQKRPVMTQTKLPCDFWWADGSGQSSPSSFLPWGYPFELLDYYVAGVIPDGAGPEAHEALGRWLQAWGFLAPPSIFPQGIGGLTIYDVSGTASGAGRFRASAVPAPAPAPELAPSEDIAPDGGMVDPFAPSDGGGAYLPDANGYYPDGSYDPAYDQAQQAQPYDPGYNPAYPASQGYQDAPQGGSYDAGMPSAGESAFDLVSEEGGQQAPGLDTTLSQLGPDELAELGLWVDEEGYIRDGDGSYLDDEGYPVLDAAGQPIGGGDAEGSYIDDSIHPMEPVEPYASEGW